MHLHRQNQVAHSLRTRDFWLASLSMHFPIHFARRAHEYPVTLRLMHMRWYILVNMCLATDTMDQLDELEGPVWCNQHLMTSSQTFLLQHCNPWAEEQRQAALSSIALRSQANSNRSHSLYTYCHVNIKPLIFTNNLG